MFSLIFTIAWKIKGKCNEFWNSGSVYFLLEMEKNSSCVQRDPASTEAWEYQ